MNKLQRLPKATKLKNNCGNSWKSGKYFVSLSCKDKEIITIKN